MMGKDLYDYISSNGKYTVFGIPTTEELAGRSALMPDGSEVLFGNELAIKCDDDLFIAERAGRILLIKELSDLSLTAFDAIQATAEATALPEALEGWKTDLCLASGYVLTADFGGGAMSLSPSPEPAVGGLFGSDSSAEVQKTPEAPLAKLTLKAIETDDKRFVFYFPETGDILILNARRFLLFALLRGRAAAGFVEIPPKE